METTEEISSGETHSAIHIGENAVYRRMPADMAATLDHQFKKIGPSTNIKFIETQFDGHHEGWLVHKKVIFVSYPHEWCAVMLKDAALFELELLLDLYQQGCFLKDLHPWNVLFEKGEFKHIDLPSLVEFKDLPNEALSTILNDMLVPYFIYPLLGMAYGKREWIRARIFNTTLNAASSLINLRDLMPPSAWRLGTAHKVWKLLSARCKLRTHVGMTGPSIEKQIKALICFVKALPVSTGKSAYTQYYEAKGEADINYDPSALNPKQRNVLFAVDHPEIRTVCDVACNTGWYAKMSASLDKSVIAFDIDEACIEELYLAVRNQKLDIVPVVASFMALTPSRYSITNGKRVLMAAKERFQSDCVLALGILHHLVLGENNDLDLVIENLACLSKQRLVLEFIDLSDDKIANHTDFFPAYHRSPGSFNHYQQSVIIQKLENYFGEIDIQPSSEPTRTLIICSKRCELR